MRIDEYEKQNYTNFGDLIFTASSETLQDIATSSIVLTDKKLLVNSFCQAYKLKDKSNININIKYLGYYLRTNLFRKYIIRYGSGYTRFNIRKDYILNAPLYLPPLSTQRKIIDIIEPIEKLENTITKFNKHLDLAIYWLIKRSKHIKELSEISQIQKFTKLINKKDLSENGKYYYSTGKTISKNKKTNLFNFDNGVSIAYEGSVIDGKYLSPQIHLNNLYIARKWGIKSFFYFSIFYSMKFTIAQPYIAYGTKMISISQERLKNIPISCANEKENYILKKLHLLITKINNLKNKLSFLKNKLLQLLIK